MQIRLNNRSKSFDEESISVQDLLKVMNYTFKMLVIKINGKLISKKEYEHTIIQDGDDVSVLHLISGG